VILLDLSKAMVRRRTSARKKRTAYPALGAAPARKSSAWVILILGVAFNLVLLGYFKYANFFVDSVNALTGADFFLSHIVLPIGISFFTFTQIAYLADAYQRKAGEYDFGRYVVFVSYFPHLVAGPILHHREMMPQFADPAIYKPKIDNFAVGLTIFTIGLLKKLAIADQIAEFAQAPFAAAEFGSGLTFANRATTLKHIMAGNVSFERKESRTGYGILIKNSYPLLRFADGYYAFRAAVVGRRRFFEMNLAKGVFNDLKQVAAKYPGIRFTP